MSGPQGSDPTQPWAGSGSQHPSSDPSQPASAVAATGRPARISLRGSSNLPAYTPQQYPYYRSTRAAADYAAAAAVPADRAVRPAGQTQLRPAGHPAVRPAARPVRQQPGQYGQQPGQYGQYPQYGSHREPRRVPSGRWRSSAAIIGLLAAWSSPWCWCWLLEARLLRHHQAGRQRRAGRCAADPHRRDQRLRRQERQGRQVQQRQNPTVKKGDTFDCEVSIDGTKRR